MEQEDLDEFMKEVKDSFNRMLSNPTEAHSQFFEMLVATLLNLEQFDFILSKKGRFFHRGLRLVLYGLLHE